MLATGLFLNNLNNFVGKMKRNGFQNMSNKNPGQQITGAMASVGIAAILYFLIVLAILVTITVLPAIVVARQCNPEHKGIYGFVAFLFPDIYLLQWSIRKFLLNEPNYCKML